MKKIYQLIIATMFLMSTASAETFVVIPGSKPGGSFFDRANLYKDVLTKMGHTVKFENISNGLEGTKYLKNSKDVVIMVYAGNQPSQTGYDISKKNFVMNEYMSPYFLCQSNESKDKTVLKVGLVKNMTTEFTDEIFKKLGKETVYLRYKNSGDLYNAITAGDIDATFTGQGPSLKLVKNNQGSCIAQTFKDTVEGVPSVYEVIKTKTVFPADISLVISNKPSDKLRNILLEANNDPLFKEWRSKKGISEISSRASKNDELKTSVQIQEAWKKTN